MDDEAQAEPEAPQIDAPIQMGASLMGMVSDPSTMVHHSGLGPFVDNSQWKKPVQDVGAKESDIRDYVGKGTAYYQQKLQESFPDLSDERKQKLLKGFSDTLTNHVREYAVERYASVLNQEGRTPYFLNRSLSEATPFVGIGTEWVENAKRKEAQQNIEGGKGQPWDFFVEALNRDRERRIANIPGGGILHGAEGLARFGIEALGAGAAGMMPAEEAPLLTRALGAGAGLTAVQLPGLITGAIAARSNPTEVAGHIAKEFINNAAFVGVAGLGSAGKQEAAGAIKSALKLMAAGEVAPDLTSGFGYLGQPGSLLATLQSKTPEERAANLANFGSQAGAALLFEGAVKLMKGGWKPTGNKVLETVLQKEQEKGQPTQTTTEAPKEAEPTPEPLTPTAQDAPGTPISTEGESKDAEPTTVPEAQAGTPVQAEPEAQAPKNKGGRPRIPEIDKRAREVQKAVNAFYEKDERFAAWEKSKTEGPGVLTSAHMDETADKSIALGEAFNSLMEQARKDIEAGYDPRKVRAKIESIEGLREAVDEYGKTLQKHFSELDKIAPNQEVSDAASTDSSSLGIDAPSVQREVDGDIQRQVETTGAVAPGASDAPGDKESAGNLPGKPAPTVPEASGNGLKPAPGGYQGYEGEQWRKFVEKRDKQLEPGQAGGPGAAGVGPAAGGRAGTNQSGVGDVGDPADHGLVADATSVSGWQRFGDFWAKLSGATAPRMTRESKPSSEKLSQLAAVRDYLHERLPQLIDKVIGRDTTPEEAKVVGTTFQEMRHRAAIQRLNARAQELFRESDAVRARNATETKPKVRAKNIAKAAELANEGHDAKKWAAAISTFVGGEGSPLTDEATYQAYANSPRMKDFLQRWQQLVVPEMEKNTRSARGLEDSDPIDSLTQMPGFPMHAKAIREGDAPLASVGSRRGNLQGMSLKRDPYQNRAGLSHTLYDTDIRSIMEESLRKTTRNARLAEFYRTAVSEGIGKWLAPNASEEGFTKIPNTKPPLGTQGAEPGDQFWIKSHLYDETHQAMGLDRPFAKIPFTNSATWWALQSTAEATYHAKNLLTGMFKPGMNVGDLFKNAYEVITKDPYAAERMVDLARMGAGTTRQSTFNLKNPMTYMGKMIDLMDRSVRLTAGDAFDRMLRTGSTGKLAEALGVKVKLDGSEASKRDFINQVAGNYNKLTQSRMVAWARDVGIGPFATAGTTYWANGVRSLVGGHGLEAVDSASDMKLRATMMAKPLAILGAVMAFNYARWNRVDGDDGTPFGSMKLGERNGKTVSFNPLVFTGLPRGIRAAGAMPALEQVTHGKPVGTAEVGKGLTNVAGSALHPFFGPAGQVVTEGVTGHNIMGMKTAPDARKGQSQAWLNWKSALLNSNPVVSNWSGADNPYKDKADWVEKAWKLLGPFGPQFRKPPKR